MRKILLTLNQEDNIKDKLRTASFFGIVKAYQYFLSKSKFGTAPTLATTAHNNFQFFHNKKI
jgi:hypothetical protein